MPLLLILASISSLATGVAMSAPGVQQMTLREAKNGELIADHYPASSLKRGEQGKVAIRITIEPDGSLGTCDVTESSGFAALDRETCEIILR